MNKNEFIFAPFRKAPFTPVQLLDVWHVAKIKGRNKIKMFEKNTTLSIPQYLSQLKICNFKLTYFDHIFSLICEDK